MELPRGGHLGSSGRDPGTPEGPALQLPWCTKGADRVSGLDHDPRGHSGGKLRRRAIMGIDGLGVHREITSLRRSEPGGNGIAFIFPRTNRSRASWIQ